MHWIDLLFRLAIGYAALVLAQKRGRDPIIWSILTLFFAFPILILLFLPPARKTARPKDRESFNAPFQGQTVEVKPLSNEVETPDEIDFRNVKWYLLDGERKSNGPFPFTELQRRFWEGLITDNTFVWTPTWKEWKKVGSIPHFLQILSQ